MRQNIRSGYFAFDLTQMVEVVMWKIQKDTCWGSELWLSLYFTQYRQKATNSLPALNLGITVSYVDHAFQTCNVFWTCHVNVITSNDCVKLLTK